MGCLVSQGGASEENSGGAAEQQPVHGDPQRERRVGDRAGGERTGAEGAGYESLCQVYAPGLRLPPCLHAFREEPPATKVMCSFPDTVGAQSA